MINTIQYIYIPVGQAIKISSKFPVMHCFYGENMEVISFFMGFELLNDLS